MRNMLVKIPEHFVHLDGSYVFRSMDLMNDKLSNCEMRATIKFFTVKGLSHRIHSLYSLDYAPCDHHLFPALKDHLGGKRFSSEAELDTEISLFFSKIDPSFYHLRIEKLVSRYNKCLDLLGEYVEK